MRVIAASPSTSVGTGRLSSGTELTIVMERSGRPLSDKSHYNDDDDDDDDNERQATAVLVKPR